MAITLDETLETELDINRDFPPNIEKIHQFVTNYVGEKEPIDSTLTPEEEKEITIMADNIVFRKENDPPFNPLSPDQQVLIDKKIEQYIKTDHLKILHHKDPLKNEEQNRWNSVLRFNHLSGKKIITPEEFRTAAECYSELLLEPFLEELCEKYECNLKELLSKSVFFLFLRGSLGMLNAVIKVMKTLGIPREEIQKHFSILDISRRETDLKSDLKFRQVAPLLLEEVERNKELIAIFLDPMFATGQTIESGIGEAISYGIDPKKVWVLSEFGAPEAPTRIDYLYPETNMRVGALDKKLNPKGYIVPGIGDYGEQRFPSLNLERNLKEVIGWLEDGIFNLNTYERIVKRFIVACNEEIHKLTIAPQEIIQELDKIILDISECTGIIPHSKSYSLQ